MNEHGFYAGWTKHMVTVRPSLAFGLDVRIGGRDRNAIKDYLAEVFLHALTRPLSREEQYEPTGDHV